MSLKVKAFINTLWPSLCVYSSFLFVFPDRLAPALPVLFIPSMQLYSSLPWDVSEEVEVYFYKEKERLLSF